MPRVGQIVPDFLHPHQATYINDNTLFEDAALEPVLDPIRTLAVFTSGKGRDNVFVDMHNSADYIREYGNPNYFLYGQPGYMPDAFLGQGRPGASRGKVYCMRVMPDNASYANLAIVVKVKVDATDPDDKKLILRHEAQYFPEVTSSSNFSSLLESLTNLTPDVDGYKTYPVMLFYSAGRGVYGDAFRIRLSSHMQADRDNDYKNYRIEVFTTENGFERVESKQASMLSSAFETRMGEVYSYYLEDVINENSKYIQTKVNEDILQTIFDLYKAEVNPDTDYTVETFDCIFGMNRETEYMDPTIVIERTAETYTPLDRIEGVALVGGVDGDFDINGDPTVRENAINDMYEKAFKGEVDRRILSKRRMPCEVIFDANYEDGVKRELIELILKRYDAYGYVDAGLLNNTEEAINWANYMKDIGDRVFSKECQHYMIRDRFTGKSIPVTTTYHLASIIPPHFKDIGNQIPVVGEERGLLTNFKRNSLLPVIDADDSTVKEALYLLRVNYYQAIGENVYIRGTQTTSQFSNDKRKWSDLSEENNMHVLLEMKRILEEYNASINYNFAEPENRRLFTEDVERVLEPYVGLKVRSMNIRFDMNEWEEERGILHCYLEVVFRTMGKRAIIEIDINKRV